MNNHTTHRPAWSIRAELCVLGTIVRVAQTRRENVARRTGDYDLLTAVEAGDPTARYYDEAA